MGNIPSAVLPKSVLAAEGHRPPVIHVSPVVVESAALDVAGVYARLGTCAEGLSPDAAAKRLVLYGLNVLARDQRSGL